MPADEIQDNVEEPNEQEPQNEPESVEYLHMGLMGILPLFVLILKFLSAGTMQKQPHDTAKSKFHKCMNDNMNMTIASSYNRYICID